MLGLGAWLGLSKIVGPTITRLAGKATLGFMRHKAEIYMGARIACTVAGTVTACKAAVTARDILKQYEKDEAEIKEAAAIIREKQQLYLQVKEKEPQKLPQRMLERDANGYPVIMDPATYTDRDYKNELLKLKSDLWKNMAKTFAMSIGLFGAGLVFDVLSYRATKNLIAGLAMTCSSLQQIVNAQREKIQALTSGQTPQNAAPVEATVTDENGNEMPVKANTVELNDITGPFELFFGEGSPNWSRDPVFSKQFLEEVKYDLNELLALRGFVTLNDMGQAINGNDFVPRKSWYAYGWSNRGMDRQEIINRMTDRIDLGVDDPINEGKTEFILRPNIDGFILADIPDDEGLNEQDHRSGLFSNLNGKLNLRSLLRR